jgi:hypothetical protein
MDPFDFGAINSFFTLALIAALVFSIITLKFKALIHLIAGIALCFASFYILYLDLLNFLGKLGFLINLAVFVGFFIGGVTIIIGGISQAFD